MTRPLIAGAALALGVALGGSDAFAQSLLSRDWLVLQPEVGVSYANVVAVNQDGLFPSASSTGGWGPHFALQAGMRFGPVSFGGRFECVPDAAVPDGGGCNLGDDGQGQPIGNQACASGFCGAANVMGLLKVGVCGQCNSDADCPGNGPCTEPLVDLDAGVLVPAMCL